MALLLAVYFIYSYRIPHLLQSVASVAPKAGLIAEVRQDFNSDELLHHLIFRHVITYLYGAQCDDLIHLCSVHQ